MQTENDAATTLDELEQVRRKVRSDRRPASVPLAVLAGAMTLFAAIQWVQLVRDSDAIWPELLMALGAPVGFAVIARWYRALELDLGVRTERRVFVVLGVAALFVVVALPGLALTPLGLPFGIVGAGLLVAAWRQRSALLAAGALVFGVGGVLETWYVLSNRVHYVYDGYLSSWASAAVWTLLAIALVALAAVARSREVRP